MRFRLSSVAIVSALALLVAGCGSAASRDPGPSATTLRRDFRGSAPSLVALHGQANQILGGGVAAFRARLRALRGHPVVVNMWASWCVPCQSEFPLFQRAAAQYGARVAFVGIDEADQRANATSFLHRFPVTYPSYFDQNRSIESFLQTITGVPQTFYFDAAGREQYDHGSEYTSLASLERDIHTYLGVG